MPDYAISDGQTPTLPGSLPAAKQAASLPGELPPEQEQRYHDGRLVQSFFFDYNEHVIWGATAKIVKQFLDLLAREL